MTQKLAHKLPVVFIFFLVAIYCITHLFGLAKLPVFADEAIYIRWAQLILDDWQQYLFFPLNDGKTPLFIWQLLPFLNIFENPLFGARLLSVLAGAVQVWATVMLVKELKGGQVAQVFAALAVTLLPFWYVHHRMALMDGWLTAWFTLALVALLRSMRLNQFRWAVVSGVFFGAALLTKVPAVLLAPSLVLMPFTQKVTKKDLKKISLFISTILGVGLLLFVSLRISPAFGQLFSRGGDFLFSVSDIFNGIWLQTLPNTPSYINYFWQYGSSSVIVLFLLGLTIKKDRKRFLVLGASFLAFYLPIALMGKVVFPRYLFPAMIFLTVSAALVFEYFHNLKETGIRFGLYLLVVLSLFNATRFIYYSVNDPNKTPYVSADREQYLTEWSAGFGTKEIAEKLLLDSKNEKIAVATEGQFGSLPDGLLLYLYNQDVSNIAVDGAGLPIDKIPDSLVAKDEEYDRLWLVVNSHRRFFELPANALLASYCRPFDAPCLELWDVTEVASQRELSE